MSESKVFNSDGAAAAIDSTAYDVDRIIASSNKFILNAQASARLYEQNRAHAHNAASDVKTSAHKHTEASSAKSNNQALIDHVIVMCNAIAGQAQDMHNENIISEDEFVTPDGTYRATIEKLGQTELLTRDIERWIADPKSKDKPPRYKDREAVDGKKSNGRNFLENTYNKYIVAKAIYRDQLTKIDKELVSKLTKDFTATELEAIVPTKSARVKATLSTLASKGFDLVKMNSLAIAARRHHH